MTNDCGECYPYAYAVGNWYVKAIHRDYKQADGQTYIVTFELVNGYDVCFGLDTGNRERIYVHGGKDVTDSNAIEWITEVMDPVDILEEIAKLPSDAYLWTILTVWTELDHQSDEEAIEGYMELNDLWNEDECQRFLAEEEENLRKKYS